MSWLKVGLKVDTFAERVVGRAVSAAVESPSPPGIPGTSRGQSERCLLGQIGDGPTILKRGEVMLKSFDSPRERSALGRLTLAFVLSAALVAGMVGAGMGSAQAATNQATTDYTPYTGNKYLC